MKCCVSNWYYKLNWCYKSNWLINFKVFFSWYILKSFSWFDTFTWKLIYAWWIILFLDVQMDDGILSPDRNSKSTNYDELRRRNREEYEQKRTKPYR